MKLARSSPSNLRKVPLFMSVVATMKLKFLTLLLTTKIKHLAFLLEPQNASKLLIRFNCMSILSKKTNVASYLGK